MLKKDALSNPASCLNKAAPDEPVFVLRAKDPFFAATVRLWAAMSDGTQPPDKVGEALNLAEIGAKWRGERQPKKAMAPQQSDLAGAEGYSSSQQEKLRGLITLGEGLSRA